MIHKSDSKGGFPLTENFPRTGTEHKSSWACAWALNVHGITIVSLQLFVLVNTDL